MTRGCWPRSPFCSLRLWLQRGHPLAAEACNPWRSARQALLHSSKEDKIVSAGRELKYWRHSAAAALGASHTLRDELAEAFNRAAEHQTPPTSPARAVIPASPGTTPARTVSIPNPGDPV